MRVVVGVFGVAGLAGAFVAQMLRWLRVLQREHYEPRSMHRFLGRWSSPQVPMISKAKARGALSVQPMRTSQPPKVVHSFQGRTPARLDPSTSEGIAPRRPITLSHLLLVALVVTAVLHEDVLVVITAILYGLLCPWGLSIKGRTGPLHWTRRLKTVALVATTASLVVSLLGIFTGRSWYLAVAVVWAVPMILQVTAAALSPLEDRRAQKFVDQASARLSRVAPRVVAITGSYGKTSTKNHLVDLVRDSAGVVASPRSFNNRAGLSRTINESLADGTRTLIAEMGTYGPGEIRDLCSWCVPEIAVVTAIGPVHLERMKSLEVIERAKFEITERARTVVVNVDDVRLARWPGRLSDKRVRTAGSQSTDASVRVVAGASWTLIVDGATILIFDALVGVQLTNLACAVAVALELGVTIEQLKKRLTSVSAVENRANVVTASSGVVVIDDTFNANPASAVAALSTLTDLKIEGRRVVITPGLIELGTDQYGENLSLAKKIAFHGVELVIVGRTNAVALQFGYDRPVRRFNTRDDAVEWVRSALSRGDGVLYLNDLPDHYP